MNLNELKLELIQKIIETDDEELLREALEQLTAANPSVLSEKEAEYSTTEDDVVKLEDMSPEFQAAVKRGLEQLDRGEYYTQEEEKAYWDQWFKEQ